MMHAYPPRYYEHRNAHENARYEGYGSHYARRFEREAYRTRGPSFWGRWGDLAATSTAAAAGVALVIATNPEIREVLLRALGTYIVVAMERGRSAAHALGEGIQGIDTRKLGARVIATADKLMRDVETEIKRNQSN
jgi:hypothetical protein